VIDTHCHLDVERFAPDRDAVLERAISAGLKTIVVPAIGPDSWEPLLAWTAREPRVKVALGIHPQLLPELPEADDARHLERLDELLGRGGAIAVGECGVDGPTAARVPFERQERILRAHFALARKHELPVLVHCLRAQPQLQALLRDEAPVPRGLLMHSFSGSADLVRWYSKRGCHFSFAGPVSFAEARRPLDAVRAVPEELLMAETDAPDQAPHPHRGERCEPAHLPLIVEALAKARGATVEAMREVTTRNARTFFRLP
jgi:TatD DNase family protein